MNADPRVPRLEEADELDMERFGILPTARAPHPIGGFLDRNPDFREPTPIVDGDFDIEETVEGISCWRHPEALLLEDELLWAVTSEYRAGLPRELTRHDYETRSRWWVVAWSELCSAYHRRQLREAEARQGATDGQE